MQTQIVNFSIPKVLLKAVDEKAKQELRTRSELMREAIRAYLIKDELWTGVFAFGEKQAGKSGFREKDVEDLVDDYRKGK